MPELEPPDIVPARAPGRERSIAGWVAGSLLLHAGVLAFLLWPTLRGALDALPPAAIEVELVAPSEAPSAEPSVPSSEAPSSEASASEEPSSAEPPSSQEPPPSQEQPSEAASSEPPPETASSAEPPPAPSEPPPESTTPVAPVPMSRPITVSVGTTDASSAEASSAEASGVTELTAEAGDVAAGDTAAATEGSDSPAAEGELHVAETFYLAEILGSASMARARDALETLPHDKRLSQTCNIEAVGQVGSAGRGFTPDAVIAEAFSKAAISGTRLVANGAIFRSAQKWYALAFDCTLNDDLTAVTAFTFRLGPDVTELVAKAQQAN